MVKVLYKPLAIIFGLLGGLIAGKIFDSMWDRIGDDDIPLEADQKEATWGMMLLGAALQGAIYAFVKAAIKRAGAQGVEKATGTWPGKTADDMEKAAA